MEDADLAFEYSDVKADIKGEILSVKNVKSGEIVADKIGEIIAENSVYPLEAKIAIRNIRHDSNSSITKIEKDKAITEDESRAGLDEIQKYTDEFVRKIEEMVKNKEEEILKV